MERRDNTTSNHYNWAIDVHVRVQYMLYLLITIIVLMYTYKEIHPLLIIKDMSQNDYKFAIIIMYWHWYHLSVVTNYHVLTLIQSLCGHYGQVSQYMCMYVNSILIALSCTLLFTLFNDISCVSNPSHLCWVSCDSFWYLLICNCSKGTDKICFDHNYMYMYYDIIINN